MRSSLGARLAASVPAAIVAVALSIAPVAAQQVPHMPDPVAVTVSPASTALLVMDVVPAICSAQQPNCIALVPRLAALIAAARKAGVFVVYSAAQLTPLAEPVGPVPFLTAIAPQKGDPIILGAAQDRFFSTTLDGLLRRHGVTTLILTGWRENGSVLYTAVGANLHDYTVVVAEDATSATHDYDVAVGRYQLLTQLNGNANNEPLKKGAVTLSRGDLITYR
ncbi:MAG: isochorismatase family protein [Candidatus Lustribacter sp.]|jgi:nicotinamidase-related amidase